MFVGYCFDPVTATWGPPMHIPTPDACWTFCLYYHARTPEIRIADLDDFLVLHVQDHILRLPLEADQMRLIDLRDGATRVVPAALLEAPAVLDSDPDLACEICGTQRWTQLARWHQCLVCATCAHHEPWPEGA
jgi:hypothetical protein